MRLTTALNEFKLARDERFPEENKTTAGAFSGHTDRLVYVGENGSLRDHSESLSGLHGIDRFRLGILTGSDTHWFDDLDTIRQHYYRDTHLVETEYDAGSFTIHQYDLTLGQAHVTHVELRGAVPPNAKLVAFVTMAPEGKEAGVGALVHENNGANRSRVLEVYHRREHDFLTASTGLDGVHGQRPERFTEILDDVPVSFPRREPTEQHEQTRLSGDFLVTAPLERAGRGSRTTLVSQLSDHHEVDRQTSLETLHSCARANRSADDLRTAGRENATDIQVPGSLPRSDAVRSDLRVLDLLSGPSGGRIAAPEFDPFYANSGGYGYVWFRDDASVSRHLLEASDRLDLDTTDVLAESARFLCECQHDDGTWPHRVWASDGSLAPGWANANVERDESSLEYQADQAATVTAFLATLLRKRRDALDDELTVEIRQTISDAVDVLEAEIDDNDLPGPCQNVWEDSVGQFAHTAATYIEGFSAVARAPLPDSVTERAQAGAERVLDGLDHLWDAERGAYVMRLTGGQPDDRLDGAALELAGAFREYDAIEGTALREKRVDRLADHVSTSLNTLFRNPRESLAAGLIRYEGDRWRTSDQDSEKIWSVTTATGALAAAQVGLILNDRGRNGDAYFDRAGDLYELLAEDGPLTTDVGYLAEQVFDDGELDSAMPLGWSHSLRLHATALLDDQNALPTTSAEAEGPSEHLSWTTGEKYGIGTVADHGETDPSRVWFTLTEGALTEARFPQVDLMNLRTVDYLVKCRGDDYTARTHREHRHTDDTVERRVEPVEDDALLFRQVFTEMGDGQGHEWTLTVDYATDPEHDAIVADVAFEATDGNTYDVFSVADIALTSTISTDRALMYGEEGSHHLAARDPRAYTGETDNELLTDENGDAYSVALALAIEGGFDWATVGAAGSERLDTLFTEEGLPEPIASVDDENVLLVGRLGTGDRVRETLALGFARHANTAAALGEADGALDRGFETVSRAYADTWSDYLADKPLPDSVAHDDALANQYRTALMTLLAVEDKTYQGASIASPSVPWGEAVTAGEARGYGYNFVWSRDLYQVFTAFETVGSLDIATSQLEYIYEFQQDEAGFIPQNTYVNGATRWGGEQMDNISYPQVMAYHLAQHGIRFEDTDYGYENVRRSADYIAHHGPSTAQERWEEESGYSPSSIAAEIAGLACSGKLAIDAGREEDALVWLALADHWANNVADWTATKTGTDIHTNTPYYVRITRDGNPEAGHRRALANDGPTLDERNIIDGGFLELVRLGIDPVDDVMRNSVKEVDNTIRVDVGPGAGFYRYNGDGYGERKRGEQGAPWSVENKGKGRIWPLLTGERGEYALQLDDDDDLSPETCLRTMQTFANSGRMIAEQVWDRQHGTEYDWEFAEGTGSATPLAWAMAQYIRLAHGISAGEPVETPAFVQERYRERGVHEPDRSPALRVDTHFRGNELVVSGETTGVRVAVKTPVDSAIVPVEAGEFEVTLDVEPGENQIIVAAAGDDDLESAGTTVRRLRL